MVVTSQPLRYRNNVLIPDDIPGCIHMPTGCNHKLPGIIVIINPVVRAIMQGFKGVIFRCTLGSRKLRLQVGDFSNINWLPWFIR